MPAPNNAPNVMILVGSNDAFFIAVPKVELVKFVEYAVLSIA
jgi:hypothetical protein